MRSMKLEELVGLANDRLDHEDCRGKRILRNRRRFGASPGAALRGIWEQSNPDPWGERPGVVNLRLNQMGTAYPRIPGSVR